MMHYIIYIIGIAFSIILIIIIVGMIMLAISNVIDSIIHYIKRRRLERLALLALEELTGMSIDDID